MAIPRRAAEVWRHAGALIAPELEAVEQRIRRLLVSREPLLTEIASYLVHSGGKRIRPAVTILAFRACSGGDPSIIIDAAAALEMIHSASLLHDDIIDGSEVRRGKQSAPRRFGVGNALVAGDFLFSRAYQICGRFDRTVIEWAAEACVSLTEGETLQARFHRNAAVTVADYMEIVARKTASLFAVGARTGAYLAEADARQVALMSECGFQVGVAFQMIDDVLDVESTERRLGKPIGIDLRDGNPSLPIVLALQEDAEVREAFEDPAPAEAAVEKALLHMRASPILARVRAMASEYAARARTALGGLPPTDYRAHLLDLIDQLVQRRS